MSTYLQRVAPRLPGVNVSLILEEGGLLSDASKISDSSLDKELTKRIIALYDLTSLTDDSPADQVLRALHQKMVDETKSISDEMRSQPEFIQVEMRQLGLELGSEQEDALLKRQRLRERIGTICTTRFDVVAQYGVIGGMRNPAALHLALSTVQALSATVPEDANLNTLTIDVIGQLMQQGIVNGRLLAAWNTFIHKWPTFNASVQAKAMHAIGFALLVNEKPDNPALALVREFVANPAYGWVHDGMRQASSRLIDMGIAWFQDRGDKPSLHYSKLSMVQSIVQEIAKPSSQYRPILDIHCNTLASVLDCSSDDELKEIKKAYLLNFLRAHLDINSSTPDFSLIGAATIFGQLNEQLVQLAWNKVKQVWSILSTSEQVQGLLVVGNYLSSLQDLAHPALRLVREFFADDTLIWAHPTIRRAATFVLETRVKKLQGSYEAVASRQMEAMIRLLYGIASPRLQHVTPLELRYIESVFCCIAVEEIDEQLTQYLHERNLAIS